MTSEPIQSIYFLNPWPKRVCTGLFSVLSDKIFLNENLDEKLKLGSKDRSCREESKNIYF